MNANPFATRLAAAAAATRGTARRDRLDRVEMVNGPAFHFTTGTPFVDVLTTKQEALIAALIDDRDLSIEQRPKFIARIQALLVPATRSDLTKAQASAFIDYLLTLPMKERKHAVDTEVPVGRYAIDINGVLWFVKIDRPDHGRWAGHTFVSRQLGSDDTRINRAQHRLVLETILKTGIREAAIRYGHELGHCAICGKELTNESSRAAGIGPKCAAKTGW